MRVSNLFSSINYVFITILFLACNGPDANQSEAGGGKTGDSEYSSNSGDRSCISQVRNLVNGAGWEIASEEYAGDGIFYIGAFKYGSDDIIRITYKMNSDCEAVDINVNKSGGSNKYKSSSKDIHRCGRRWSGNKYMNGAYGDYCGLECYAENYPN